ncbi:TRAP transporter small permease [Natribacillus halophilus]|uniref:TRAP-type C4-dicarboxylate transport system, small permease component n=1 Tax=Natribacillus halophilus TaxID=549003 RepID=A0A1G8PB63_9BACI|nr:TRAP transporter small permease [Natribacillus halophilus]SDI89637.1 TRAP-type C4-dicarboxylate transport system, small permease component [Natribacillus halophilus]
MKILKGVIQGSRVICLILLILIGVLLLLSIITRFFGISISWTDEVIQFSTVWMIFLGAAVAFFDKEHISLNLFNEDRMRVWIKFVRQLVISVSAIIVCLVFIIGGWELFQQGQFQSSPILQWPRSYWYLSIPLCGLLIITVVFIRFGDLKREKEAASIRNP